MILFGRFKNLIAKRDPFTDAALSCSCGGKIIEKVKKQMGTLQNKELIDRHHAIELDGSYSGNGLSQVNFCVASSSWIDTPPRFWSGRDYVQAMKLKCNMLPTAGVPYNPRHQQKCQGACTKIEFLSHVFQQCPATHWKRVIRHDRVCNII